MAGRNTDKSVDRYLQMTICTMVCTFWGMNMAGQLVWFKYFRACYACTPYSLYISIWLLTPLRSSVVRAPAAKAGGLIPIGCPGFFSLPAGLDEMKDL